MKLRSAYLQKVKGIGELEIDFVDPVLKKVRDRTVIVGKNGSGKTTFLEAVYEVITLLETKEKGILNGEGFIFSPAKTTITLDFPTTLEKAKTIVVETGSTGSQIKKNIEIDINNDYFASPAYKLHNQRTPFFQHDPDGGLLLNEITSASSGIDENPTIGNLLYFPTDRITRFEVDGEMTNERPEFKWSFRYNRNHNQWKGSLESFLAWTYFRDLKLRETAPDTPSKFKEFATFVNRFLEGKEITGVGLDYRVEVVDLVKQRMLTLDSLSSGEKQIVLFVGEIMRNIRQGSLLLIDEPELHLHPVWQKIFIHTLTKLCKSYDAQFILTTQSPQISNSVLPSEVVELDDLLKESAT